MIGFHRDKGEPFRFNLLHEGGICYLDGKTMHRGTGMVRRLNNLEMKLLHYFVMSIIQFIAPSHVVFAKYGLREIDKIVYVIEFCLM